MLNILQENLNTRYGHALEWAVIFLIIVECLIGLVEVAGMFGWAGAVPRNNSNRGNGVPSGAGWWGLTDADADAW